MKLCVICQKRRLLRGLVYFCKECYTKFKDEILSKEGWVQFLIADEQKNKRDTRKDIDANFIYLGDSYDISDEGKLVKVQEEDG